MDTACQMGYPAIAKARRLSAERLGAPVGVPQQTLEQRAIEQVQIQETNEQGETMQGTGQDRRSQQQQGKTCQKRCASSSSSSSSGARTNTGSKIITGGDDVFWSPPPRPLPTSKNPAVVVRDLPGSSPSISPLPSLPPRHGGDSGSMERTFADIGQVRNFYPLLLLCDSSTLYPNCRSFSKSREVLVHVRLTKVI